MEYNNRINYDNAQCTNCSIIRRGCTRNPGLPRKLFLNRAHFRANVISPIEPLHRPRHRQVQEETGHALAVQMVQVRPLTFLLPTVTKFELTKPNFVAKRAALISTSFEDPDANFQQQLLDRSKVEAETVIED